MLKRLITAALLLSLAACTTHPPKQVVTDWQRFAEHQQQLTQWQLSGKLAVRLPSDSPPGMNIKWQQQQKQYAVRLSGAMGAGTTHINGNPHQVVMQRGDQKHIAANSEELTWQLLGVPLSVENLTYWVRGIPSPGQPVMERSHDNNGALQTLSQDGWQLQFSRYTEAGDWLLPGMIKGQRGELSFKLRIKSWEPGT